MITSKFIVGMDISENSEPIIRMSMLLKEKIENAKSYSLVAQKRNKVACDCDRCIEDREEDRVLSIIENWSKS